MSDPARPILIPDEDDNMDVDPAPTMPWRPALFNDANGNLDVDPTSLQNKHELQRWLRSSSEWNDSLLQGWQAVKYLGRGGNGAAGLWRWSSTPDPTVLGKKVERMDEDERQKARLPRPGTLESYVKEVVVKQSIKLGKEAGIMEQLTTTGSTHVPELYARVRRAVGRKTHNLFDPKGEEVQRLFMEYFPGGNLRGAVGRQEWFRGEERQLWSLFVCLSKAVCLMEMGKELPENENDCVQGWNPVTHGDLKGENVFVDKFPKQDGEHICAARVAVGDFGGSSLERSVEGGNKVVKGTLEQEREKNRRRVVEIEKRLDDLDEDRTVGMMERFAEQGRLTVELDMLERLIKTGKGPFVRGNVFDVGVLMYELVNYGDSDKFEQRYAYEGGEREWQQFQNKLWKTCRKRGFSKKLCAAVVKCLHHDPKERLTPYALLQKTMEGLKSVDAAAGDAANQTLARPRGTLVMLPPGEKSIWESDWNSSMPLAEWNKHQETLENNRRIKGIRDGYKKQGGIVTFGGYID